MKKTLLFLFLLSEIICFAKENKTVTNAPLAQLEKSAAGCADPVAIIDLNINNVRASILSGGDMWWNLVNGSGGAAQYEVPQGSGKNAMFAGAVWIGGYDAVGNLVIAAQTYRQSGSDYFTGPVSTLTGTPDVVAATCNAYDRFWKITKAEVQDFVNTGTTVPDITSWPGNGNIVNGELPALAPFEDVNGDGLYNTSDGDYPRYNLTGIYNTDSICGGLACDNYIFGDQTIWWVFNDVGNVKGTGSAAIGIEVRAQAFEFATANGVNNCTFYKYQIINRSASTYDSSYFGFWLDPDLGDATDDWIGCDTVRGLGYCYNATNFDGTADGYGANPPAIGIDFLQGPVADNNPCQQIIMSGFMYYNNDFTNYGNPESVDDYYQYMSGSWKNGDHWSADLSSGTTPAGLGFPATNYIYPGDPFTGTGWTEASAGNPGGDKRGVISAGKFNMQPGEVNYITASVIWARGTSNLQSVQELKALDDTIQSWFATCFNPALLGIKEHNAANTFQCYPNPFSRSTIVKVSNGTHLTLTLYNAFGKIMEKLNTSDGTFTINRNGKAAGVYFYTVSDDKEFSNSGKLVIN